MPSTSTLTSQSEVIQKEQLEEIRKLHVKVDRSEREITKMKYMLSSMASTMQEMKSMLENMTSLEAPRREADVPVEDSLWDNLPLQNEEDMERLEICITNVAIRKKLVSVLFYL